MAKGNIYEELIYRTELNLDRKKSLGHWWRVIDTKVMAMVLTSICIKISLIAL